MRTVTRGVAASLVGAAVLGWVGAAVAAGPPLDDYTVFGINGVVVGFESTVNGLVGAVNNDPGTNEAIKVNQGAKINDDARSGGNVALANNASIAGSLYRPAGTTLTLNNGSSVGTDLFPIDPMLPTLPTPTNFPCPTGGPDVGTGGNGDTVSLTMGSYGALNEGSSLALTLAGGGDFFFDSINVGSGATLTVDTPNTRVFVCGKVLFGSVQVTTPAQDPCSFSIEVHGTDPPPPDAFQALGNSNWVGDIFAPFGTIHFGAGGSTGTFVGRVWSNAVDIEHSFTGSSKNCSGGGHHMEQFQSNKDSTILHFMKNTNNGANLSVRVGYQVRGVLGFDVSTIPDFTKVTSAKLVLTVVNNPAIDVPPFSPDSGWGAGGQMFAGRLDPGFETWAEGNGNNFPTPNNPRGTGSGITWNCATDTNIANQKADCSGAFHWKNGAKNVQGPPRGPALLTDGLLDGTQIQIDVTADVQAGLAPDTQFMSWVLTSKGMTGAIAFYSKEGAAFVGNASFAPVLVITQ
jgi:hypothetical protein